MTIQPSINKEPEKKKEAPKVGKTDDLFQAHDFDIKIDLEVPLPSKYKVLDCIIGFLKVLRCSVYSGTN